MKKALTKLCSPILDVFDKGAENYAYKPLNRKILVVMGLLFSGLTIVVIYLAVNQGDPGFLIPVIVFAIISIVTLVVGLLGSDRAVARIWGNR